MKETGILFTAPMVRAIMDGTKTQTRRIVKPQPVFAGNQWVFSGRKMDRGLSLPDALELCPFGAAGDQLYAKETFVEVPDSGGDYVYRATDPEWNKEIGLKWSPSIFMPKSAARIWLEITAIGADRVQDITEADAKAEGVCVGPVHLWKGAVPSGRPKTARQEYRWLWDDINEPFAATWENNPWVWKITFRRIKP